MKGEIISVETLRIYQAIEEENKKLFEENERLKREKIQKELCESLLDECDAHNKYLQQKIDKAIEYLKDNACYTDNNEFVDDLRYDDCKELLNILEGESNE